MIRISKKRVKIIISAILMSIIIFCTQLIFIEKKQTLQTTTEPIENKIIIVDAGHGTPDEGAESENGTTEAKINLQIAYKLKEKLEQTGATIILTRKDEYGIYDSKYETIRDKKISDMKNRVKIANESSADIFVSIHMNKIDSSKYYGWQCFYNTVNSNSKNLAQEIQNGLNDEINIENTRKIMKLDNIYLMKKINIPISIVECGFLSNPEEEKKLQKEEYQDKLANGICNGIMQYFNSL